MHSALTHQRLQQLGPFLASRLQGLYSLCDDGPLFPDTDRAPTNGSPGRVRSAKDRFPLADQIAFRILETRNHPKDINTAQSHLKNRMHRLQQIRQTLKRGLLSTGQFASKPQHKLIAVITVQGLGKKGLQIEIAEKEVFPADFQNGHGQLRLKPLRAPPHLVEADKQE